MTAIGFELAWAFAAQNERSAADSTDRTVGCLDIIPVGCHARHGHILEHARSQPIPAFVEGGFNLTHGCLRVLEAPLAHATQDLGAQGLPGRVFWLGVHLLLLISQNNAGMVRQDWQIRKAQKQNYDAHPITFQVLIAVL